MTLNWIRVDNHHILRSANRVESDSRMKDNLESCSHSIRLEVTRIHFFSSQSQMYPLILKKKKYWSKDYIHFFLYKFSIWIYSCNTLTNTYTALLTAKCPCNIISFANVESNNSLNIPFPIHYNLHFNLSNWSISQ